MNREKGISLITLIFTIIVIVILSSVVIYFGINKNLDEANFTSIYTEITEIGDAVSTRGIFNTIDENSYSLVGTKLGDGTEKSNVQSIVQGDSFKLQNGNVYGEGYYLIKSSDASNLNVQNVKGNYIVNYATGEVISIKPILYEGRECYTIADISTAVLGEGSLADARYDSEKKANAPILNSGMIPVIYDEASSCWKIVSRDSEVWYDYRTVEEGASPEMANRWANIMLLDKLETENYTNRQIMKMSKSELETNLVNEKVTTMGSMFVWIPRYTYKINTTTQDIDIKFSVLYEDNTNDGYIKHPAFYYGGYSGGNDLNPNAGYSANGFELSGIWMSKFEAGIAE